MNTRDNTTPLDSVELDRLARKRAGAKLGWIIHALVYLVVNAVLFAVAYQGGSGRSWPIFPALGWGLGLALHGAAVFVFGTGGGVHQRLVEREREKLRRQQR